MTWKHLFVLITVTGGTALWIAQSPPQGGTSFPMPAGKTYVEECGSCHTAFPPGMLPARSWRKMMNQLSEHFGEDASLDEPHYFAILKELETLASDGSYADMRMRRISAAIAANEAPQRITDTAYFKRLHDEVPAAYWKRKGVGLPSNCIACHLHANEGRYAPAEMRIPAQ